MAKSPNLSHQVKFSKIRCTRAIAK